jgi:carbamoyltransferase
MNILGINAFHGDAAAALVQDGRLVAAVAEERLNRQKHCAGFPARAIEYCLREGGIRLKDIDHIGISRKPSANFHRKVIQGFKRILLPNTWRAVSSMASVGNVRTHFSALESSMGPLGSHCRVHHLEHHLTHAASAFLVSPFKKAAILTLDGFGDFSSGLLGIGEEGKIRVIQRIHFPHSLGVFYTALTQYLGFPHYGDEGKVMALASFGEPRYMSQMRKLVWFDPDSLVQLGLPYFTHHSRGVAMSWAEGSPSVATLYSEKLEQLLGPARKRGEELNQHDYDVAASLQGHLEEVILEIARHLASQTGETRLCLAGGVALNSVVNGRIREETPFRELFIQPAAADDGTSIGCAFLIQHQILGQPRSFVMDHAYWGPSYTESEIERALAGFNLKGEKLAAPEKAAAESISQGKVIGWFQGRMEFGPRALGNRSILGDPRNPGMKALLNERVKHREPFRPFAPSLLQEETGRLFNQDYPSPYMLLVYKVRPGLEQQIGGALHIDQTGRLQTVTESQNPLYYRLLQELKARTGQGIVINTSFNDSEPIVCTPEDAIKCFLGTKMDELYLGGYRVLR